ncbi:hypothetical protein K3495_g10548, partial [Podosphaera aphanis]
MTPAKPSRVVHTKALGTGAVSIHHELHDYHLPPAYDIARSVSVVAWPWDASPPGRGSVFTAEGRGPWVR